MKDIVLIAYITVSVALFALVHALVVVMKKKNSKHNLFTIVLSLFGVVFGMCVIYFNPNYIKEDFIRDEITPNGYEFSYKTNPEICEVDESNVYMCPTWIQNNIRLCLSIETENGISRCNIILGFPSKIKIRKSKMYVNIGKNEIGKCITIASSHVECNERNVCFYSFDMDDFSAMLKYGITSVAFRSPYGIGLWNRFDRTSLVAINEQMVRLMDYHYFHY